jgi:hypothetical protein
VVHDCFDVPVAAGSVVAPCTVSYVFLRS